MLKQNTTGRWDFLWDAANELKDKWRKIAVVLWSRQEKREQPSDWSSRNEVTTEECQLVQTIISYREEDGDLELEVLRLNMTQA